MNILGISAFYHDSAACLLSEGRMVAAAQEERFTRKRHDQNFPIHSIEFCLKQADITMDGIDLIAFYEKPYIKFERILESILTEVPYTYDFAVRALPVWIKEKLWMRKTIERQLGRKIPVLFFPHHEAHAASAFFPSPFQEAATLTVDGVGEWSTTTWGMGRGNRLELKSEIRFPHSIGLLYSAFTQYLGFRVNSAEYKVMGLAPYGEPKYTDLIRKHLVEVFPDGSYLLNMEYFSFMRRNEMINEKFEALFGMKRRVPESPLEAFHTDVARSLQVVTEELLINLANHVWSETKMKYLCLAGGVALNCVANGKILKAGKFKDIWIQPGAGDAGGAVGAAFLAWHHVEKQPRPTSLRDLQQGSFLGPDYAPAEIEAQLLDNDIRYVRLSESELVEQTSILLAEQKIVGWFQGRMEFGPRALGARSILGDARNPEMQKRMNLKIKFRESFRPFAPSILAEDAKEYFAIDVTSPYMLLTCQVVEEAAVLKNAVGATHSIGQRLKGVSGRIPAVTHVDGSARVHTVEKTTNPLFYKLIASFKSQTGSPVLINTSFNVRGEPIVCTPRDAIRCFLRSDIDALAVGPFLARREDQSPETIERVRKIAEKENPFGLD